MDQKYLFFYLCSGVFYFSFYLFRGTAEAPSQRHPALHPSHRTRIDRGERRMLEEACPFPVEVVSLVMLKRRKWIHEVEFIAG